MENSKNIDEKLQKLLYLVNSNSLDETQLATKLSTSEASIKGIREARNIILIAFMRDLIRIVDSKITSVSSK